MSRIRSKDTVPEKTVRSVLHKMGFRFRLHRKDLPGRPDIVLPKHRLAIFVHGCFWHRHPNCKYAYTPKSRLSFWRRKFAENRARDRRNAVAVRHAGWRVLILWECECNQERIERTVKRVLSA
jgi:DNA mismatch endonuclease, patch repair protein